MVAMFLMSWQLALDHADDVADRARGHDLVPAGVGRAYLRVRDSVGGTLTALQEGLAGVRVIQAFDQTRPHRR